VRLSSVVVIISLTFGVAIVDSFQKELNALART
jgi:hypothetical protein